MNIYVLWLFISLLLFPNASCKDRKIEVKLYCTALIKGKKSHILPFEKSEAENWY